MTNRVTPTPHFLNRVKPLIKKFHSLTQSLLQLEKKLIENPRMGVPYGSKVYKIRLADESKGRGKSGSFRVITYLVEETDGYFEIFLIDIFNKSDESTISKSDVIKLIRKTGL